MKNLERKKKSGAVQPAMRRQTKRCPVSPIPMTATLPMPARRRHSNFRATVNRRAGSQKMIHHWV